MIERLNAGDLMWHNQLSYDFRAIDTQALIGNIGGYIGLCLGYSLLQVPQLLSALFGKIKKFYLLMKDRASGNKATNLARVAVAANQSIEVATTSTSQHISKISVAEALSVDDKFAAIDARFESIEKLMSGNKK